MPEGHTIHRAARDQGRLLVGEPLEASSPQGRFADGAKRLDGRRIEAIEAVGKNMFYRWAPRRRGRADILHVHLGLYGKFRVHRLEGRGANNGATPPEPRGAVRLRVIGPSAAIDLNGPNRCELLDESGYTRRVDRLGPDPLRRDADPERAWTRIARSRASIGALLMNQEVIAGVGNIYRSEVLHLLGIHPERLGRDLDRREFDLLWEKLVELMGIGVRLNRIVISNPDEVGKPRSRMNRDERLRIYKKSACPDCGSAVDQWDINARRVYACNTCQD